MVVRHPLFAEASALHRSGHHAKAIGLYQSILHADAWNFEVLFSLGLAYGQMRQFDQAQAVLAQALIQNPGSVDAYILRSFALKELSRFDEAILCLDRALAIDPTQAPGLLNRAALHFRVRKYQEAGADYEHLLSISPDYPYAIGNLLFTRLQCCDWRDYECLRSMISAGLELGKPVIAPFDVKALSFSGVQELRSARIWVADQAPTQVPLWHGETYKHDRTRIAYVSADFHAHALGTLTAGVFEKHDRSRFESFGLSLGRDDGSDMRSRLARSFDQFLDIGDRSDLEIAEFMRRSEIDIAVDLMGFTEGGRPGIFAVRPAPIQVNYLGFPGTIGADYIDYVIGDNVVTPVDHHRHYSENVALLPDCFLPSDDTRLIGQQQFSRMEEGLPEDGFVFCCFNASYKINPSVFDIWMRILGTVPGSVLWLGQANAQARKNLEYEAELRGLSRERLVFAAYQKSAADHLSRLGLADLFLDTFPYNAHATASDALWAGVPVLTCQGETYAGRVGSSLLHAIGLSELIATSHDAYERIARDIALRPGAVRDLKEKLNYQKMSFPLFDTKGYTRYLEAAYQTMWDRHQRGLPPQGFAIEPIPRRAT